MQDPILQVRNVKKRYGKFTALEEISFEANQGTHTLMLGPNGAGKTTLLKCMMGLVRFEGNISINGFDVKKNPKKAKTFMGYVPQNYAFYENLSVLEHARFSSRLKASSADHVDEQLRLVDLWDVRMRKVKALSDGMKQRLGIALALIGNPPLLLLDEPTSNVDLKGQLEFYDLLKRLANDGKTLMTTTHLSGLGETADEVIIIDRGRLVAKGPPDRLLEKTRANDILYVRVSLAETSKVADLIAKTTNGPVSIKGEWVTVPVSLETKIGLIRRILESGYEVRDLMAEHSRIESEYVTLIGGVGRD